MNTERLYDLQNRCKIELQNGRLSGHTTGSLMILETLIELLQVLIDRDHDSL